MTYIIIEYNIQYARCIVGFTQDVDDDDDVEARNKVVTARRRRRQLNVGPPLKICRPTIK